MGFALNVFLTTKLCCYHPSGKELLKLQQYLRRKKRAVRITAGIDLRRFACAHSPRRQAVRFGGPDPTGWMFGDATFLLPCAVPCVPRHARSYNGSLPARHCCCTTSPGWNGIPSLPAEWSRSGHPVARNAPVRHSLNAYRIFHRQPHTPIGI